MYSIQLYDDTAQEYGAKISQGLQSPISATERLDGGIDTARFTMHTKLAEPPKQWQKVRLWTQGGEPFPEGGWSAMTLPGGVTSWVSTAYGNGLYFVSGLTSDGSGSFISSDGEEWEQVSLGGIMAFGAGKFVAMLDNAVRYSADGKTWTDLTASVGASPWDRFIYGDGKFIGARRLTSGNRQFAYSADGVSWSRTGSLPSDAVGAVWNGLAAGNGIIAVSTYTINRIYLSFNGGDTWEEISKPNIAQTRMLFANGKFYIFRDGKVETTTNFVDWEEHDTSLPGWAWHITYGGNRFFAVKGGSASDVSYWSLDGIEWFAEAIPNASYGAILYGGNKFVALSAAGVGATISATPAPEQPYKDYFVDSCRSDLITRLPGLKVYRWDVELVGLIKVTQKLPMGNLCFSNDVAEDGTVTQKTYAQVLDRLNNQIFTVLEEDRDNVPFRLRITPTNIPFLGEYAPELFFTGNTLFECLERIGQTQDSFPELFFYEPGVYTLAFRKYNDPNAAKHTNTALNADVQYHEAENHAEIVDSTVENYLYIDDKYVSGAGKANTAMTWPMDGEYGATSIEPYSMEDYTPETCFLELPFEVAAIIKVEVQLQYIGGNKPAEITGKIIEFEKWKTLPTTSWDSYWKGGAAKRNRGRFAYNSVRINNLTEALVLVDPGDEAVYVANQVRYRVTYVPIRGARIKKYKLDSLQAKPLTSIVNQQANILDGEDYCSYLEALVDKMSGEYKTPVIKAPIGEQYRKGEYLNGEIITQAEHTYFYKHVESVYTTSARYNRKSEFVEVDHNLRQWSIPADRVQNRYIHYAQDLLFALDEGLPITSGALSEGFIEHYHSYFAGATPTSPSVAFLAFKTYVDYYNDASTSEWSDSRGYGLLSCKGAPLGKSISFAWAAADNASLGSRGYYVLDAGTISYTQRQMFVEYPAAAEYLQFFMSSVAPTNFNYNSEYTGVGNNQLGADIETRTQNKNFAHTFPLSNKAQFRDGVAQIDFSARTAGSAENLFRIQKDLRERILFCFQLDMRGIGDTIVFKGASVWSPLSNDVPFSAAQIFYSSYYRYSGDEQKAIGNSGEALSVSSTPSSATFENPTGANVSGLASYAIADVAGNLLFARNAPYGETIEMPRYVVLRLQNSKKQYIKI